MKETKTVRVLFRLHPRDGDALAFFPDQCGKYANGEIRLEGYSHLEKQFGSDLGFFLTCKRAKPDQYRELLLELNELGYQVECTEELWRNFGINNP